MVGAGGQGRDSRREGFPVVLSRFAGGEMGADYVLGEVTGAVIGAAMAVHAELGPGFLESVYESALVVELRLRGIPFERQRVVPVVYEGVEVGKHVLDLLVAGKVVVELKAVSDLNSAHRAQLASYLKATGNRIGLLLNFSRPSLQVRRHDLRGP